MWLLTSRPTPWVSLNGSHAGTSLPNDQIAQVSISGRATNRAVGGHSQQAVTDHNRDQTRQGDLSHTRCPKESDQDPTTAPTSPTPEP